MAISCWADSNFDPYQRRPKQLDRLCLLPRRRIMSGSEEPPLGGIPSPMPWHIRTTETGLEMTQELRKNSPKIAMDTWRYMNIHLMSCFFGTQKWPVPWEPRAPAWRPPSPGPAKMDKLPTANWTVQWPQCGVGSKFKTSKTQISAASF